MSHRSLHVFPDESAAPILEAIAAARKSLRVKMFLFSDPALLKAVIAAHHRGVDVRVMLNDATVHSGRDLNKAVRRTLEKAGIPVNRGNPAFKVTHEKSMVVDEKTAFVKSLNWATENLTETRDYAVKTSHPREVAEIVNCFEADWRRQGFVPGSSAHLVWCPGNGRERVAHLIDSARHTLFVQGERYQDAIIIEHLVRARMRGVKVRVMARPPHTLRKEKLIDGVGGLRIMDDVGIKVHHLKQLKSHGKLILADGVRAIVGSINLTPSSFDGRRELAIEVSDEEIVERLHEVARRDWKHSHALDLSDEGLLEDLEQRVTDAAQTLVLDVTPAARRKIAKKRPRKHTRAK